MRFYPAFGHMIEITKENVAKLDKIPEEMSKRLFEMIDEGEHHCSFEDDEDVNAFLMAFVEAYGLRPDILYLNEETEGCDGAAEPEKYFFFFADKDKYTKTVRPEWEALPFEPEKSCWSILG
jgi:hypothetical protein